MDFHDVIFPLSVAFGASGGPQRQTEIISLADGSEQRNSAFADSRRRYNAGAGIKTLDHMHELIAFFEARRGQLYGFRFKDPMDHKSCKPSQPPQPTDQSVGQGDGETRQFQLTKRYGDPADAWRRPISKPVSNSVALAINGNPVAANQYSVDPLTGLILFQTAPALNAQVTAGFEFHVPVRFDTDQLDLTLEAFGAGDVANIPLIEVPHHA